VGGCGCEWVDWWAAGWVGGEWGLRVGGGWAGGWVWLRGEERECVGGWVGVAKGLRGGSDRSSIHSLRSPPPPHTTPPLSRHKLVLHRVLLAPAAQSERFRPTADPLAVFCFRLNHRCTQVLISCQFKSVHPPRDICIYTTTTTPETFFFIFIQQRCAGGGRVAAGGRVSGWVTGWASGWVGGCGWQRVGEWVGGRLYIFTHMRARPITLHARSRSRLTLHGVLPRWCD
jgi:hypothetical protein